VSCWTAIYAIEVIIFTIITRITSSKDELGLSEILIRNPVMDSSILLE